MRICTLLVCATVVLAVACASPDALGTATPPPLTSASRATQVGARPTPTPLPTHAPTPTQSSARSPFPTEAVTPPPGGSLSAKGPWLAYYKWALNHSGFDLVAVNPDGTGRTVLSTVPTLVNLRVSYSPASPWIALTYSGEDGVEGYLSLYHLPDGQSPPVISLFSLDLSDMEPTEGVTREELLYSFEEWYVRVILQASPHVWSPGGRYLAFLGAVNAGSADLFVYDTQTLESRRLTRGSGTAYQPSWYPYGTWIVVREIRGYGDFYEVTAVYAVPTDGGDIRLLYEAQSFDEEILGWLSADSFVVASFSPHTAEDYGPQIWQNVRIVSLSSGNVDPLYSISYSSGAFDPTSRVLAFTVYSHDQTSTGLSTGLYTIKPSTGLPELVEAGEWVGVHWAPATGLFYAEQSSLDGKGVLAFTPARDMLWFVGEASLPLSSPDGHWLAFYGTGESYDPGPPGLRVYSLPEGALRGSLSLSVGPSPRWRPDSQGIFFTSGRILYYFPIPDGPPIKLDEEVLDMGWVGAPN